MPSHCSFTYPLLTFPYRSFSLLDNLTRSYLWNHSNRPISTYSLPPVSRGEFDSCASFPLIDMYDQRCDLGVPPEVWSHVLEYLRPMDLSQVQLVNKTFHQLANDSPAWRHGFMFNFEPSSLEMDEKSETKTFKDALEAHRLHLCQKCWTVSRFGAINMAYLPVPYKLQFGRTIRLCRPCRVLDFRTRPPVPIKDSDMGLELDRRRLLSQFPGSSAVFSRIPCFIKKYKRSFAIQEMRKFHGGDEGLEASRRSTKDVDDRTRAKVQAFIRQRKAIKAARNHTRVQKKDIEAHWRKLVKDPDDFCKTIVHLHAALTRERNPVFQLFFFFCFLNQ